MSFDSSPHRLLVGADAAGASGAGGPCLGGAHLAGQAALLREMLQQPRRSASSPGVGTGRRGWSGCCWMGWPWSWTHPLRVPTGHLPRPQASAFGFGWVGLTFPRGAKSQMWFTAWPGDRGRQNPLSNAQGTPIPEASLRSSCCLSLVITGSLSLFMPLH